MKRALLALGFALVLVAGCDSYKDDIAAVQAAETAPGKSNAELAKDIAGANGKVEWSAMEADGREDTVRVIADIERPSDDLLRELVGHDRGRGDREQREPLRGPGRERPLGG